MGKSYFLKKTEVSLEWWNDKALGGFQFLNWLPGQFIRTWVRQNISMIVMDKKEYNKICL
jgi:hypothetical protein